MPISQLQIQNLCLNGEISDELIKLVSKYFDNTSDEVVIEYLRTQLSINVHFNGALGSKQNVLQKIYTHLNGRALPVLQLAITVLLSNQITEFPADTHLPRYDEFESDTEVRLTPELINNYIRLLAAITASHYFEKVKILTLDILSVGCIMPSFIIEIVCNQRSQFPCMHGVALKRFSVELTRNFSSLFEDFNISSISFEALVESDINEDYLQKVSSLFQLACDKLQLITLSLCESAKDGNSIFEILTVVQSIRPPKLTALILNLMVTRSENMMDVFATQTGLANMISLCLEDINHSVPVRNSQLTILSDPNFDISSWCSIVTRLHTLTLDEVSFNELATLASSMQYAKKENYIITLRHLELSLTYQPECGFYLMKFVVLIISYASFLDNLSLYLSNEFTSQNYYYLLRTLSENYRLKQITIKGSRELQGTINGILDLIVRRNDLTGESDASSLALFTQLERNIHTHINRLVGTELRDGYSAALPNSFWIAPEHFGSDDSDYVAPHRATFSS